MASTACTTTNRPLWVTIPGARVGVPAGWVAWMVGVGLAVPAVVAHVGAAGAVIGVLAVGWLVARRVVSPLEWLRGYHVDDTEVTAMGPGRAVRRLPWYRVHTLIQERGTLTFVGDGMRIGVPLQPLVQSGAWTAVLARVVPELADELWALLEELR